MPSSDSHGSSMPFASFRRSIMSIRSEQQVHSLELNNDSNIQEIDQEAFQKLVSTRFQELSVASADEFLSIAWIQKLLDAFTSCQEEFRIVLCNNKELLLKSPQDKLLSDYFDRTIKALDICNAARDGIGKIRLWQKHLEIVVSALDSRQKMIGEGQLRRTRKSLMDLALVMLDEKESGSVFSQRNRSFGRHNKTKDHQRRPSSGHSRSLSWSVSQTWSASKQLQSIASHLVAPRGHEVAATNGIANLIFTMNFILLFVLWVLVAAVPCQDRSLQIHFSIPRQFSWSNPLWLLHGRIMDEAKKPELRNSSGLLKEVYQIEKCVHHLTDLIDSVQLPLTEDQMEEVKLGGKDLSAVCEALKIGLYPLERHLKEVFRKIMSCRAEGLELLGSANQP
ncbi:protein BYPASS1-LIKE-like [Lycium barbarum]|uniref:protein BYPASS1-LIKE-like n=1 Tax=Lycium barbarum TaxID=112863 RepID=UPI00293F0F92|nr:protein BYPASS1-LIKE-like [Lycium barbarum]